MRRVSVGPAHLVTELRDGAGEPGEGGVCRSRVEDAPATDRRPEPLEPVLQLIEPRMANVSLDVGEQIDRPTELRKLVQHPFAVGDGALIRARHTVPVTDTAGQEAPTRAGRGCAEAHRSLMFTVPRPTTSHIGYSAHFY